MGGTDWQFLPTLVFSGKVQRAIQELEGTSHVPTRNINLTEHYDQFVADQVRDGRFKNASEVLRAGLHLLEQQSCRDQEKLLLLKALAAEGFEQLDQGQGIEIDSPQQLSEFIESIGSPKSDRRVSRKKGA